MQRLRAEFDELIYLPAVKQDPSLAKLSKGDFLNKMITLESAGELPFTTACMLEALRIQPPAGYGNVHEATCDMKLGKYEFKKGDMMQINF